MKIYNYHPITFEYLSTADADADPLDPDNHLIPAHATPVEVPAAQKGEAAIFSEATQTWSLVPDLRGQVMYDQTTGAAVDITDLGPIPAGLGATIPAAIALVTAKKDQLAVIETAYNNAISAPINYMGAVFQADDKSQALISRRLTAGSVPAGFYWQDIANAKIPMSYADLQGLSLALSAREQTEFDHLQALKLQINDVETNTPAKVGLIIW